MKKRIQLFIARKLKRWFQLLEKSQEELKLSCFANIPSNLRIDPPYRLINPENVQVGEGVYLGPDTMINCVLQYPSDTIDPDKNFVRAEYTPSIRIGNRVSATAGLQLAACEEIVIEDDVLFATNVHINDSFHGYQDVSLPFKFQQLWKVGAIRIGRGSWLGQNVVVSAGVSIGKMCIIGANSVVNTNIPDYSIAVGSPATVIKQWCHEQNTWVSVSDIRAAASD